MDTHLRPESVLEKLRSLSNPQAVAGMARYGIKPENAYGVSIPALREMAAQIGKDPGLAGQLWASRVHEARILAGMIDDPKNVTEEQMENWVRDFDSWDVCDQCCMNLFQKVPFAYEKSLAWSRRPEEFVKRAGFVLMARFALSEKQWTDDRFYPFLTRIKEEATDSRNYVKKAVNWALRQIGKRNLELNERGTQTALEIQATGNKAARWVASDALRELRKWQSSHRRVTTLNTGS